MLADTPQIPKPLYQPAPQYPPSLRRDGLRVTVHLEFTVDSQGRVGSVIVFESEHSGFNEAASFGVSNWRFRPGMRSGAKVNTRMWVPIVFTVVDSLDRS